MRKSAILFTIGVDEEGKQHVLGISVALGRSRDSLKVIPPMLVFRDSTKNFGK